MTPIDWPLGIVALVFFGISWLYGWGLVNFFGDDPEKDRWFLWDWASVMGIAATTSITYTVVWMLRKATGYQLTWAIQEQHVWDLFVMFAAALFAMRQVRIKLVERRRRWYRELEMLREEKRERQDLFQELMYLRKENKVLQKRLEAKKNCEQRSAEQIKSLTAVLRIYETRLNIIHKQSTEIVIPAQPEGLKAS